MNQSISGENSLQEPDYWILSDRVFSPEKGEASLALAVTGNCISQCLPAEQLRKGRLAEACAKKGLLIIDEGNRPLVPGFVNGHSHLALAPLRGITSWAAREGNVVSDVFFQVESHLCSEDVRAFTRMGAYESLLHGVLCTWDHFYFGEAIAAGLCDAGLCGVVAPTLQDVSGPGAAHHEQQLLATAAIHSSEKYQQAGVFAALGPHAGDTVSAALFERIGEYARRLQIPVHLHLAQAFSEMQTLTSDKQSSAAAIRAIVQALEHCQVLMAHGIFLDAEQIRMLVAEQWTLAYCPLSQLQFGFLAALDEWTLAGGKWALGTDCVASNDALDVQRELPLAAAQASLKTSFSEARRAVLESKSADSALLYRLEKMRQQELSSSSRLSAEELLAAGMGERLPTVGGLNAGALQVGSLANFLVLDPNHPSLFPGESLSRTLAYSSPQGAICYAAVAGKIRGRSSGSWSTAILRSAEYTEAREEAVRRRAELLKRASL